ncbi:MAG: hypothetical protein HY521_09490 [Proteobacteria bacterium]|nr:hypothetical protein [Pseudomonadota bacterium]
MGQLPILTLVGASFERYKFETYPMTAKFGPVAAVYAITLRYEKEPGKISQRIIYIGETNDMSRHLDTHPRRDCIFTHKANAISLHLDNDSTSRRKKVKDLVDKYMPKCNEL